MESNGKTTLVIRADANAKIGSGHIMRCFALAQSWQMQHGKVIFVTNCESSALIDKLKNEDFEVVKIESSYPDKVDFEKTKEILDKFKNSWCVVDGYHFDNLYYSLIRQNNNRVLAIDDTIRLPFYEVDAILNQNVNAEELNYKSPAESILLLGTKYTMLRQEFLKWRDWQRETLEFAHNILITMGGGDFYNQTQKTILAIEKLGIENLFIKAVVGSSNPHLEKLEKLVKNSTIQIDLIQNAENMAELMKWADLAISAAGSTCWELCFMKVPTVLIVTADNQIFVADGLSKSEFAENLGWFENVSLEDLTKSLRKLLPDKIRREKMAIVGREIIDGKGTMRIIGNLHP